MTLRLTGAGKSTVYRAPTVGRDRTILLYNFDVDSPRLKREHKAILETLVVPLLSQGGSTTLKGMASRTGSDAHNDALSVKRADAVKAYLMLAAPTAPHVFVAKGIGEKEATSDLEDQHFRSVLLVVSPDKVAKMLPDKPVKPTPQIPDWRNVEFSLRSDSMDILKYRKFWGHLYLAHSSSYIVWTFSVSSLNLQVGAKGAPPVGLGNMEAVGRPFQYDFQLIDPWFAWRDKGIHIRIYGDNMDVTIRDALPRRVSPDYRLFKGSGVIISGRNIRFTMKTNSGGALGVIEGTGYIEKPVKKEGQGRQNHGSPSEYA